MPDFSAMQIQWNTGTDLSPNFTAQTAQAFGGSGSGPNELRFCAAGAGSAVPAVNWPIFSKPVGVVSVPEAWVILTDNGSSATGYQAKGYTGSNANALVGRLAWSLDGTFASAISASAFANPTHVQPSAGTQPPGPNNDGITNGHPTDTNSTGYLKANFFGVGVTNAGVQQTPLGNGTQLPPAVTATAGSSGAATTSSGAWLTSWQSLQGFNGPPTGQWIADGQIPQTTGVGGTNTPTQFWYFSLALFAGPNLTVGTDTPVLTFQYTFS